jgi:hypothetical protein
MAGNASRNAGKLVRLVGDTIVVDYAPYSVSGTQFEYIGAVGSTPP